MAKRAQATELGAGQKPKRSPKPKAASPKSARSNARPASGQIRVRMYRQGLGDCFLVSLLRPRGKPFHLMIDCGVILGTPNAEGRLRAVVNDIVETTSGVIDVLVVTHEHYDHVAGFVRVDDLFGTKLKFGEVWFAWTEDRDDKFAQELRKERENHLSKLAALATDPAVFRMAKDSVASLADALAFFGVKAGDKDGHKSGDTATAMRNAAALAKGRIKYHNPGDDLAIPEAPELRFYVLGPPKDRKSLMKRDAAAGVYHLSLDSFLDEKGKPLPEGGALRAEGAPFEAAWTYRLSSFLDAESKGAIDNRQGAVADFIHAHYFRPTKAPMPDADMSWRRVDGAWLDSSEELALALDSATNNTSLALAIEIVASGEVLLFPGDAQVGSWLSWQNLSWASKGLAPNVADLFSRTIFLKVGHHGSHNATLKDMGLEKMTHPDLVANIPVDQKMAVKKHWNAMPLQSLTKALNEKCGGRVLRIDKDLKSNIPGVTAGGEPVDTGDPEVKYDSLYFDWTAPL